MASLHQMPGSSGLDFLRNAKPRRWDVFFSVELKRARSVILMKIVAGAGRDAGLASDADAGVLKKSDGGAGNRNVLSGLEHIGANRDSHGGWHARLGDAGKELSPGDGHVSPLS